MDLFENVFSCNFHAPPFMALSVFSILSCKLRPVSLSFGVLLLPVIDYTHNLTFNWHLIATIKYSLPFSITSERPTTVTEVLRTYLKLFCLVYIAVIRYSYYSLSSQNFKSACVISIGFS